MLKCSCGEVKNYYTRTEVAGTIHTYYDADGIVDETGMNSDMYGHLRRWDIPGKFCSECNERVG